MTKLLVLSDSHGGRAAIERVLMKESKSIDALIFLGDGLRVEPDVLISAGAALYGR